MRFKEFLLNEDMSGPPGGMGAPTPGGMPPAGGAPMPGAGMPPGGGGMGMDPMGGGGMGGMGGPPGGGMGGAGGSLNPQVNLQLKSLDVWTVLDEILNNKKPSSKNKNSASNKPDDMLKQPDAGVPSQFLMA